MSQTDYVVPNSSATTVLNKLNAIFGAISTTNAGNTPPTETYPHMLWSDQANDKLKIRSQANDLWIELLYLNQSASKAGVIKGTPVYNNNGDSVGSIDTQTGAVWAAGTSTVDSLISPAKLATAVEALAPGGIGDGQSWSNATRTKNTIYQNTTGKPINVLVRNFQLSPPDQEVVNFEVSDNGSSWVSLGATTGMSAVIPNGHYYRVSSDGGTGPGSCLVSILA